MPIGGQALSLSRVLFYLLLFSFYIMDAPTTPLLAAYVLSVAFFIVSSAVIVGWVRAPHPWRIAALTLEGGWSCAIATVASLYEPDGPMAAIFSPIFVTLFFLLGRRWTRPALAGASGLWLLSFAPEFGRSGPMGTLLQLGIYGAFNLFAAAMGALMRNLADEKARSEELLGQVQKSQVALERAHRQLIESAARQQEMAVLEERQRLAREIHDSVAHNLTALVVQLQAARRLLDQAPERTADVLTRCEEMARLALLETRQAVRALHPAGLSGQSELEALRRLGRDFGAATGIAVTVEADEAVAALPPDPNRLEQLYRIFQEALTNAHRHGGARRVTSRLALSGERLELVIHNDGAQPASLEPGLGLRAMSERARSLGGDIHLEPGDGGLTIRVTVPVKQEAVS